MTLFYPHYIHMPIWHSHDMILPNITLSLWLWLTVRHGKFTMFKFGKPSVSMGHLCHGYVSHNQRVYIFTHFPYFLLQYLIVSWFSCSYRLYTQHNHHQVPLNHHKLPWNHHKIPLNHHKIPLNQNKIPFNHHKIPLNHHKNAIKSP